MIVIKSKRNFNRRLIKMGFSKRGFARANNIAEATLIQISNGKQSPRPETAIKICNGLKVEFDDIFLITENNESEG